jgi:hypothetical protein
MLERPTKPLEEMTPEEVRQWKAWMVAEGKEPSPLIIEESSSHSVFDYDEGLKAVVERTPEGRRYRTEIAAGRTIRGMEIQNAHNPAPWRP